MDYKTKLTTCAFLIERAVKTEDFDTEEDSRLYQATAMLMEAIQEIENNKFQTQQPEGV